ncbi:MAG: hypothetical protein L6Q98_10375 [Anaerolineae bacterium]|nr:hypothetical protein [Anaerolineae bacterium]NUQ03206.1 hypothetical protein [Anaerolineae bacterium]
MQSLYAELEAAMEMELVVKVLDILIDIAEIDTKLNNTTSAVEILALALEYPMRGTTFERALAYFSNLECQVCSSVVQDARALAQEITLEEMVARILSCANAKDVE